MITQVSIRVRSLLGRPSASSVASVIFSTISCLRASERDPSGTVTCTSGMSSLLGLSGLQNETDPNRVGFSLQLMYALRHGPTDFGDFHCSIARTVDVVGERWTPLILRDVMLGVTRFDDIQRDLGVARNVLAARLDALVEDGILERRAYQEHPVRHEYVLTEKGRELATALLAMMAWGDRWESGGDGPPVQLRHEALRRAHRPRAHVLVLRRAARARELTAQAGRAAASVAARP